MDEQMVALLQQRLSQLQMEDTQTKEVRASMASLSKKDLKEERRRNRQLVDKVLHLRHCLP